MSNKPQATLYRFRVCLTAPVCLLSQELAQRALVSYLRSVFLQPNRAVFDVTALPVGELAAAWGLSAAPRLRFLQRQGKKVKEVTLGGDTLDEPRGASAAERPADAGALQAYRQCSNALYQLHNIQVVQSSLTFADVKQA